MADIYFYMDKKEISKILTKRLRKEININKIEPSGSGRHSDGYKLITDTGEEFFIKKIKAYNMGFEFPERKISSLLIGHAMLRNVDIPPKTIGVAVKNKEMEFLPEISEETEIYHIQKYGGEGKSYLEILSKKANKKEIDNEDKKEIDKIIDFIVKVHKGKHPSNNKEKLNVIYNDYLRNVIGNPEYLLMLLHNIPHDNLFLNPKEQGEFMKLMLDNMHYFKDRHERLVSLHGDFWGANVFLKEDGEIFVIDYSRMPWGDAGFDIGFWMSQYLFQYHTGNKEYFKQLGEYFLEQYIQRTGDKEIMQTMVFSLGLVAAMYASSVWVPDVDDDARKFFFEHVCEMLKIKKFFW